VAGYSACLTSFTSSIRFSLHAYEALKDEQFFCEEQGAPFTKHNDMQVLQRHEKQQVEADEYTKDWIACFEPISKIIHVEEARNDDDTKDKLIAVGNETRY
jgi:hypothetical protein